MSHSEHHHREFYCLTRDRLVGDRDFRGYANCQSIRYLIGLVFYALCLMLYFNVRMPLLSCRSNYSHHTWAPNGSMRSNERCITHQFWTVSGGQVPNCSDSQIVGQQFGSFRDWILVYTQF